MPDHRCMLLGIAILPGAVIAAAGAATDYRPTRLPDGQPDLQGIWDHRNVTPLERPAGIDTLVISQAQATAIERRIYDRKFDPTRPAPAPEFFPEERILPIRGVLRSSVIVDPEDGRLPGTAAFDPDIVTLRPAWMNSAFDGPEQRDGSERCLGNPASQPWQSETHSANVRSRDRVRLPRRQLLDDIHVAEWTCARRCVHGAQAGFTAALCRERDGGLDSRSQEPTCVAPGCLALSPCLYQVGDHAN